ncbi:MAG: hypothetical protein KJ720_02465 [Proteobacteria bacterium]|nr:hypothetical protein [Pseudomonadota bacterium]MBU1450191.1 hypothetical protein [Pseudomonadota bacterium]MBU2468589.1 hypothetical protein [Pseudomonadota bacterium]MBU2517288.1 hypothetical protein [Pseudomonadota bacterium]
MKLGLAALTLLLFSAGAALAGIPVQLAVQAPSPELAAHARQIVERAAPRLEAWTGIAPSRIRIEVLATRQQFEQRMAQLGGPRWAAGLALPGQGLIVLRSPRQLGDPEQFRYLLIHELTHLYLAAGLRGRRAPLWLEEGLAMRLSGEGGWTRAATMTGGVLGSGLLPMDDLEHRFPPQAHQAALAYAQSYYLIIWLQNEFGPQALPGIIKGLSQGRPLTAALMQATGLSMAGIEERFTDDMHSRFSWIAVLGTGGVLWALLALGAMVGLVLRRRRQKAAVARMDDHGGEQAVLRPRPRRGRERQAVLKEAGMDEPEPPKRARSQKDA